MKNYEFSLKTEGIDFPMKSKHISKFEKLNPSLPGINVFSVNDNKKFYPLRMAEKDCLNTIDLFFYERDGVSHYSLIKNFTRLVKSQITSSKNVMVYFIFVRNALLILLSMNYYKNTSHIVQLMKRFMCVCHQETQCYVLTITTNNFQFLL